MSPFKVICNWLLQPAIGGYCIICICKYQLTKKEEKAIQENNNNKTQTSLNFQ